MRIFEEYAHLLFGIPLIILALLIPLLISKRGKATDRSASKSSEVVSAPIVPDSGGGGADS